MGILAEKKQPTRAGLEAEAVADHWALSDASSGATGEIDSLAGLPEGWDGEGAPRISAQAIANALALTRLCEQSVSRPESWRTPAVAPTYDGGVHLSWERDGDRLSLQIPADRDNLHWFRNGPGQLVSTRGSGDIDAVRVIVFNFLTAVSSAH